eukprot:COSAG06_NODE_2206_length_7346_cov_4.936387_5_plen_117_part_00
MEARKSERRNAEMAQYKEAAIAREKQRNAERGGKEFRPGVNEDMEELARLQVRVWREKHRWHAFQLRSLASQACPSVLLTSWLCVCLRACVRACRWSSVCGRGGRRRPWREQPWEQ